MPIPLTGLCPLIQVYDMLESVVFYERTLGLEIIAHAPRFEMPYPHFNWAHLKRDAAELMLNTLYEADQRPAARDPARQAAHADTILYFGCPDVDAAWRMLTEAGLALEPPRAAPYGMRQLYFRDPDGYALFLQWRT